MATPQRIIGIVGAAVSGPVFAVQILSHPILRKNFKPIIFEQLGPPQTLDIHSHGSVIHTAGAAVGIFQNGLFPLYELGLRDELDAISNENNRLSIYRGGLDGRHRFYNTLVNQCWDAEMKTCPRAVERRRLRDLLLGRYQALGGEISWDKKVQDIVSQDSGLVEVSFTDGTLSAMDLLIGADGAWSMVRKHILNQRNPGTADKRWVPSFTGVGGIYGISSGLALSSDDGQTGPPLVLLDQGNISYLPLSDGKVAWTMHIPEQAAPQRTTPIPIADSAAASLYESKMVPGVYDAAATAAILRQHEQIYHPILGTWKPIFEASERIIRSPLRLQTWEADEIQAGNVAVIGDAARVLPPYAGQGASMGIEDATVLADALLNNLPPTPPQHEEGERPGEDFRAALEEYARRRVPRSKKVAKFASWSGVLGMGEKWYWRWLRDWGARMSVGGGDPKKYVHPRSIPSFPPSPSL